MGSALHLRSILDSMATLRYMTTNIADMHLEPIDLATLRNDLAAEVASLPGAAAHDIQLYEPVNGLKIKADRARLMLALGNVLDNAVRFTPAPGTITIDAKPRSHEVWISVQDTGVGITAENIERVFDEFFQVENHMTRAHGGLGIGLSVARTVIKLCGGRIWAESQGLGRGSTLTIALPQVP
ncbi:MAG: ATP-binding protein [Chloroflexi bacterium]|nr:ATP-binding protein [Chloroflexota bacterium]